MTDFRKLYDSMDNPIDDENTIKVLMQNYANENDIYNSIIGINQNNKKYKQGEYYQSDKNELYAKLFNYWKANILSLNNKQINALIKMNYVEKDYYQLQKLLENIPNIDTKNINVKKELRNLSNKNPLIKKYEYQFLNNDFSWNYIDSRFLNSSDNAYTSNDIKHRLYLNIESIYIYQVASLFIDKCKEQNLPFHFKFDEFGARDDAFVIYSDTENLDKYLEILKEIKKENSELKDAFCTPTALAGIIDGWIGYGSEPQTTINNDNPSFNEIRSIIIEKVLNKSFNSWIYANQNNTIIYKNRKIPLTEYLSIKIAERITKEFQEDFQEHAKKGLEQKFYDLYGLVSNDFNDNSLQNTIKLYIEKNIKSIISNQYSNNPSIKCIYNINTRENKSIEIYTPIIIETIKKITNNFVQNDQKFIENIIKDIKKESKKYGIDPEKYCFDNTVKKELFKYSDSHQNTVSPQNTEPEKNTYSYQKNQKTNKINIIAVPYIENNILYFRIYQLLSSKVNSIPLVFFNNIKYIKDITYGSINNNPPENVIASLCANIQNGISGNSILEGKLFNEFDNYELSYLILDSNAILKPSSNLTAYCAYDVIEKNNNQTYIRYIKKNNKVFKIVYQENGNYDIIEVIPTTTALNPEAKIEDKYEENEKRKNKKKK